MRVLVLSDTHRNMARVVALMKEIKNEIDIIIHLGDNTEDAEFIRRHYNLPVYNVSGNCDSDISVPEDDLVFCGKKKIFITHGHRYGVKYGVTDNVIYRAMEAGADVCLFGHTHIPMHGNISGIEVMNPGSISLPRGGSNPSYGIINIIEDAVFVSVVDYK